jgi:hypothetical protein
MRTGRQERPAPQRDWSKEKIMNPATRLLTAIVMAGIAAAAGAQYSPAPEPLRSDYRLKVIEPAEGASISGNAVRVVVDLAFRPRDIAVAKDVTPTPAPKPQVDIFLDKEAKGSLKEGETYLVIDGVAAGTHTLLVTASDRSGAVVDRKEVHFTVLPPNRD